MASQTNTTILHVDTLAICIATVGTVIIFYPDGGSRAKDCWVCRTDHHVKLFVSFHELIGEQLDAFTHLRAVACQGK